jgi:hypothetical protein
VDEDQEFCEEVVPVAVARLTVAFMTDGRRQKAVEPGFRAMHGIGPGAKLLDEFGRADHRLENRGEERAILADPINLRGNADEFALRVELDVASITPVDRAVRIKNWRRHAVRVNPFGIPDDATYT